MKVYMTTILLLAGIIVGCNSNKSGARSKSKKKSYNYSAARPASSNPQSSNQKTTKVTVSEINADSGDTLEIEDENPYYRNRPRTNFQGASGVGTGGSYASSYYRQESMKKKKKKDQYKNRNFDHLYQDENTAHLVPKKDTSSVVKSDTTALEW